MAVGAFAGGTGVEGDPYLIEDAFDLDAVRNDASAHYKLISDIDLDIAPFNEGEGWIPIKDFSGTIDGNDKKVYNLYINTSGIRNIGLFGSTSSGLVQNLGIENVNISSVDNTVTSNCGVISGQLTNATIKKCYTKNVTISGDIERGGGLIGYAIQNTLIENCYTLNSQITTTRSINSVGILVGEINGVSSGKTTIVRSSYGVGVASKSNGVRALVGNGVNYYNVNSSYYDSDIAQTSLSGSYNGTPLSTQQMKTKQTFSGWDDEIWGFVVDGYYPMFYPSFINKLLMENSGSCYSIKNKKLETRADASSYSRNSLILQYPLKAINGNISTGSTWQVDQNDNNIWFEIEFPYYIETDKIKLLQVKGNALNLYDRIKDYKITFSNGESIFGELADGGVRTTEIINDSHWSEISFSKRLTKSIRLDVLTKYVSDFSGSSLLLIAFEAWLDSENVTYQSIDDSRLLILPSSTEDDFLNYGMDTPLDLDLTQSLQKKEIIDSNGDSTIVEGNFVLKDEIGGNPTLLYYTDDINKTEVSFTVETEPFTLKDELNDEFDVLVYTDDESNEEIAVNTELENPVTLYDVMGDEMEILYYTDDASESDVQVEFDANYSPLDEVEGDFDVVTWTNQPPEEIIDNETSIKSGDVDGGEVYETEIDLTKGNGVTKISKSE